MVGYFLLFVNLSLIWSSSDNKAFRLYRNRGAGAGIGQNLSETVAVGK